jgi:hypothetical protein
MWRLAQFVKRGRCYGRCVWVRDGRPEEIVGQALFPRVSRRQHTCLAYQTYIRARCPTRGRSYLYVDHRAVELLPLWQPEVVKTSLRRWQQITAPEWREIRSRLGQQADDARRAQEGGSHALL